MLHLLLAAGLLGCVAGDDSSITPLFQGVLFQPNKGSSGIFNNNQTPQKANVHNSDSFSPAIGYQPSNSGSVGSRRERPHIEGSILSHGPPESFDKSSNSDHDPFSSDRRVYPSSSPGIQEQPQVKPSPDPFSLDSEHSQTFHPRRLLHPKSTVRRHKHFGNFDDDLLTPIEPIKGLNHPIGSPNIKNVPDQHGDPFNQHNRQPEGDQYNNRGNRQYVNNHQDPSANQQPPPYSHNDPHPAPASQYNEVQSTPTDTPAPSGNYPTDNHDRSRPNPPTPSIPTFGQPLTPPAPYIPPHKHNRNNGPSNRSDRRYHDPRNRPTSRKSYKQEPSLQQYPERNTDHGPQNNYRPSYQPHQNQQYSQQAPNYADQRVNQRPQYPQSVRDQGQQYHEPNSHGAQYHATNPHQGEQYSNQGPLQTGHQNPVNHGTSGRQYPDATSNQGQQYTGYQDPNAHQNPPPNARKQYPHGIANQGPQYPVSRPHHNQPYADSDQNHSHGSPANNLQQYQHNRGSEQPHQPGYATSNQNPQYPSNQIGAPHSGSEYPDHESEPRNPYVDQQLAQRHLNHHQPHGQSHPVKSFPAVHDTSNSYPPHSYNPRPSHPPSYGPSNQPEYNKSPNVGQNDKYPSKDHRTHNDLDQTPAQSTGSHAGYPNHGNDHATVGLSYPPSGDTPVHQQPHAGQTEHPGGPPGKPINQYPDHSSQYPDKTTHQAAAQHPSSYPDKQLNLDPSKYSGTAEHPNSYQDKLNNQNVGEQPGSYKTTDTGTTTHEYPASYPAKTYPDTATKQVAENTGSYLSASSHPNTHDDHDSYPPKTSSATSDISTSYPEKGTHRSAAVHPEIYPGELHPDTNTNQVSNEDKNKYVAADQPSSYPIKNEHAIDHPGSLTVTSSHPHTNTPHTDTPRPGSVAHSGSYPDESSHPSILDYPPSYPPKPTSDTHPTSYPDDATHLAPAEHSKLHPETLPHPDSATTDYPDTNPDKENSGSPSIPAKTAIAGTPKHGDSYPLISTNPGEATSHGLDHLGQQPNKAQESEYPGTYPDNTHPVITDHAVSHTPKVTVPDKVKLTESHPSKLSDVHPYSPKSTDTPLDLYPPKSTKTDVYLYPSKSGDTHADPYPPKSTNTHLDSYPPKSTKADVDPYPTKAVDSHIDPYESKSSDTHLGSHPSKSINTNVNTAQDGHADPHPSKSSDTHLGSYPSKLAETQVDSYPPKATDPHVDSYPPKSSDPSLDSYPPKSHSEGAPRHVSYPDIKVPGYQTLIDADHSSTGSVPSDAHPKIHVNSHNIHSKFPRNRYPESVKVSPSYPEVIQKADDDNLHSSPKVINNPVTHSEAAKSQVHEVKPPSEIKPPVAKPTPFIPPGLQGQCFRYKDLSAGYKLSHNTFGYPEDEIAAEVRRKPFLAPILGFKNFVQPANQFDIDQFGLGGLDRPRKSTNAYLYAQKDYPAGYKEGDFDTAIPRDYTCRMTSIPLRMFHLHGGRCWAVNPDFKKITYKKCYAPGDYCGAGRSTHKSRCSEDYDWVEVWSYCEKASEGQRTKPRKLYLPVGCSCKSYYC